MNTGIAATPQKPLPRYQCHKIVSALKIKTIEPSEIVGAVITPEEEGFIGFPVSAEFMAKHNPQVGGYFVVYEDGYQSYSPAQAFEEGYTRI